jgi:hypothetical protein
MKRISDQEQRILDVLIYEKILPVVPFEITEEKIISYMHAYVHILKKKPFNLDTAEYRYSRKLAGLTLIKYNLSVGAKLSDIKAGFVYLFENRVYPDHYKVGMCVDVEDRLSTYQTYDPYRSFKLVRSEFVLDRRETERKILTHFKISLEQGEWVKRNNSEKIFRDCSLTYRKILAK